MLFFALWLTEIIFQGISFWSLHVYVYTSLLLTKATAEAIIKHLDGKLSLLFGAVIASACHLSVMSFVALLIRLFFCWSGLGCCASCGPILASSTPWSRPSRQPWSSDYWWSVICMLLQLDYSIPV